MDSQLITTVDENDSRRPVGIEFIVPENGTNLHGSSCRRAGQEGHDQSRQWLSRSHRSGRAKKNVEAHEPDDEFTGAEDRPEAKDMASSFRLLIL